MALIQSDTVEVIMYRPRRAKHNTIPIHVRQTSKLLLQDVDRLAYDRAPRDQYADRLAEPNAACERVRSVAFRCRQRYIAQDASINAGDRLRPACGWDG